MKSPALLVGACLSASLIASAPSVAQRRIVGSDPPSETPAESPPAESAPPPPAQAETPAQRKKREAAERKQREAQAKAEKEAEAKAKQEAAAAAQREAEEAARQEAEAQARRDAERQAEEDKKRQAEEAQRQKEEEARRKEEARLQGLREGRLAAAKSRRRLMRDLSPRIATVTLEPGAPEEKRVQEVRFDLGERLKVADPKFGTVKPLLGATLRATVVEPTVKKATRYHYQVHALSTPGQYGFHHTPRLAGTHRIVVEGSTAEGTPVSVEFPLHVGTWPPPDFDDEEKNNLAVEGSRVGRRMVGAP